MTKDPHPFSSAENSTYHPMKTKTSPTTNLISRSLLRRGVLLIRLVIAAKRKAEHDHTVRLFE